MIHIVRGQCQLGITTLGDFLHDMDGHSFICCHRDSFIKLCVVMGLSRPIEIMLCNLYFNLLILDSTFNARQCPGTFDLVNVI